VAVTVLQQAANYFRQALARGGDAGDRRHEALALTNLGIASFLEGSYRQAIGHLRLALARVPRNRRPGR
jgi:tetratricopeptide (TPR) repeat protein